MKEYARQNDLDIAEQPVCALQRGSSRQNLLVSSESEQI